MSKILALDTSTDACSVALCIDGETREDFRIIPRQHTKQLLPMIQAMLDEASLKVSDLDSIAFGRGPGSFAGIRIATGVAQGLAFAAELKLLPISTLASMAYARYLSHGDQHIIAALDARMDEIYWAAFVVENGRLVLQGSERVDAPANVQLPEGNSWVGIGSGWNYLELMSAATQQELTVVDQEVYPHAAAIAQLGAIDFAGGLAVDPELALPVYLRDDVAWKKKDQQ